MAIYRGTCHCGGVAVDYETAVPPGEAEVRACQCSFCRMHGARAVSDPEGRLSFAEKTPGALRRYSFALKTADYILCGTCGAYLGAALSDDAGGGYGIVNILVLDTPEAFTQAPQPFDYDAESVAARIARRRERWTPMATA